MIQNGVWGIKTARNHEWRNQYNPNTYLPKKQLCLDRDLSPWSSEEYRTIRADQKRENIKFTNNVFNRINSRYQEGQLFTLPQMGKSLQLTTNISRASNKISQQFYQLVKLQKKKTDHRPNSVPLKLTKIYMTLNCTQDRQKYIRETLSISLNDERLEKEKQIPVQVKIAKKMRGINKRENDQQQTKTDNILFFSSHEISKNINLQQRKKMNNPRRKGKMDLMCQKIEFSELEKKITVNKLQQNQNELVCKGDKIKTKIKKVKYHLLNERNHRVSIFTKNHDFNVISF